MTNYEKVIEDIHQHVDESMLKTDLAIALFDESTKEEEVKQLFKMYYTKELIDLTLLKECVSFFVRQNQSMVYNDELCKRACQLHNDIPKEIEELVYVAGAKYENEKLYSAGGRVLGVVDVNDTLKMAINGAYEKVEKIKFDNAFYRHDIGQRALKATEEK